MTVMPLPGDVADKAVSTEDGGAASSGCLEVARLEAVISALVEGKLEAMKADSRQRAQGRLAASEPVSPRSRLRLASSSTFSSAAQQHQHQQQQQRHHRRHRRHGSAPCQAERARRQSACDLSPSQLQQGGPGPGAEEHDWLGFGCADELCGPEDGDTTPSEPRPERFHRTRRKRRRRRRRKRRLVDVEAANAAGAAAGALELELGSLDPDDLPPRARWTIVATACLLLAMSLLLVGVTLRMAPIIDEMVRKENEELLNSLNRQSTNATEPPLL